MSAVTATIDAGPGPSVPARRRPRRLVGPALEAAGVLVSPVVAFVVLGVRGMVRPDMIDPYFYAAYAQQGSSLVSRFGTENYFWVRVGFILPARTLTLLLGPLGGFVALRYLLAVLAAGSAYLLLRRLHGRAAGAVGVAVVLSSPVLWYAWGTDYPDSTAVSYLLGAMAALAMPARGLARRLGWVAAGGVLCTFAVHSQLMAAPVVAAVLGGWAVSCVVRRRTGLLELAVGILVVAACAWGVTQLLVIAAERALGSGDLFTPTVKAVQRLSTPEERAKWHSAGVGWLWRDTYLFVLPAALGAWLVLVAAPRRRRAGPSSMPVTAGELTVVAGTALTGLAYVYVEFGRAGSTLEYFLYSSMLWPGVCLTTALVLVRLAAAWGPRAVALTAAAVVVVAAALSWPVRMPEFDMAPVGLLLVLALVGACVGARLRPARPVTAAAVGVLLVTSFALTVGKPADRPRLPGQVLLPAPRYDDVLATSGRPELDAFRAAARLPDVVPPPRYKGDQLVVWTPPGQGLPVAEASAQYLWHENSLDEDLPALTRKEADYLYSRKPGHLLLLASSDSDFPSAVAALDGYRLQPQVERQAVLRSGDAVVHVWFVRLGVYDRPTPG